MILVDGVVYALSCMRYPVFVFIHNVKKIKLICNKTEYESSKK